MEWKRNIQQECYLLGCLPCAGPRFTQHCISKQEYLHVPVRGALASPPGDSQVRALLTRHDESAFASSAEAFAVPRDNHCAGHGLADGLEIALMSLKAVDQSGWRWNVPRKLHLRADSMDCDAETLTGDAWTRVQYTAVGERCSLGYGMNPVV